MLSRLRCPIQAHIDRVNDSMPAVHHYTTLQGALGILQSGRIWFTERAHLNDPTEIRHGVEIAQETLRERGWQHDAECLRASADRVFDNFRFFSASFSLAYDDRVQWRDYGDNRKGVLLSFRDAVFDHPKEFIDRLIAGDPTAFVCPISYGSEQLRSLIASIIGCWDRHNIGEVADHIFMISSMFKSNRWKSEKEYRFFLHQPYSTVSQNAYYKTRQRGGDMVAYLDLPVQNWNSPEGLPVYRICLGPNAPPGVERTLAAAMEKMRIWPREGIVRSSIP